MGLLKQKRNVEILASIIQFCSENSCASNKFTRFSLWVWLLHPVRWTSSRSVPWVQLGRLATTNETQSSIVLELALSSINIYLLVGYMVEKETLELRISWYSTCDSNKNCTYAALDSDSECTLYSSCHQRKLVKNTKGLISIFEKGMWYSKIYIYLKRLLFFLTNWITDSRSIKYGND